MNGFEGSFLGHSDRIRPATALECGVCWWVYDPAVGDESAQIPAGTAFADLPPDWRCPGCDNAREQFMVLGGQDASGREQRPAVADAGPGLIKRCERDLYRAFAAIDAQMRVLPVYNQKLDIQVVGMRRWREGRVNASRVGENPAGEGRENEGLVGVVATPWCMNIVVLWPAEVWPGELPANNAPQRLEGTSRELVFPSGSYSFNAGQLPGVGALETCSLFSPMDEFDDPAVVRLVAEHALAGLFESPADDGAAAGLGRRRFLSGGRPSGDHAAA
jgi:[NiFe] hydrogenase assembly HybE family chaperone